MNTVGGVQSTAIWDGVGFLKHLHRAGRNDTGPGTADHCPSEDVDGNRWDTLGISNDSKHLCLDNQIIPSKSRQEHKTSKSIDSFSVLLRVYSDLIASLQHVLNDAGSEKSKSLEAGVFAIIMLFYAISFPTWYNRPPGLPLSP